MPRSGAKPCGHEREAPVGLAASDRCYGQSSSRADWRAIAGRERQPAAARAPGLRDPATSGPGRRDRTAAPTGSTSRLTTWTPSASSTAGQVSGSSLCDRGRSLEQVMLDEKAREDWIRGTTNRRFPRWGSEHITTSAAARCPPRRVRHPPSFLIATDCSRAQCSSSRRVPCWLAERATREHVGRVRVRRASTGTTATGRDRRESGTRAPPIWPVAGRHVHWGQPKTAGHRRARKRTRSKHCIAGARAGVRTNSLRITLRALAPELFCFCR